MRKILPLILVVFPALIFGQQGKCSEGQKLLAAFKYNEAVSAFYTCHAADQEDVYILTNLAYCYAKVGNLVDAERSYKAILKIDSTHQTALLSIAQLSENQRKYDNAIYFYDQLIAIDSTNGYAYKQKGLALLKKEKRLNAIYNFLKSHGLQENDQEVIYQLTRLYIGFDQYESAEIMLKKGLDISPDNIRLLQLQAQLCQRQEKYPEVISTVKKLMNEKDSSSYYMMLLGAAYMNLDSFQQALFPLEYVIRNKKENEFVHHYLGIAYQNLGDKKLSETHFLKAIEAGFSSKQDLFFRDYGNLLNSENRTKEALDAYKWAHKISSSPDDLFEIARLTDVYYADKKMAIQSYQRYLKTGDQRYRSYSEERIEKLKEILHFQIK